MDAINLQTNRPETNQPEADGGAVIATLFLGTQPGCCAPASKAEACKNVAPCAPASKAEAWGAPLLATPDPRQRHLLLLGLGLAKRLLPLLLVELGVLSLNGQTPPRALPLRRAGPGPGL